MKTVITAINTKYIHSSFAPWCLLAGIREYCTIVHDVQIYEANLKQQDDEIVQTILSHEPDIAAFSCYIWNITCVRDILSSLKIQRPQLKIILGGPEVSHNTPEVMDTMPEVDYIISGEGERPIAVLLDSIARGQPIPAGYGVSSRLCGDVDIQPAYTTREEPPSPFTAEYLPTLKGRIAYLETSRGCPFSCAFCLSGREEGVRFFGIDRVKREISLLMDSGAKVIKLVDRTFNCNPSRAYEILEYIISVSSNKDFPTFHLEVGADLFDNRTLSLLERAPKGLFQIEAGIQSFNEDTLSAIDRHTDLDAVKACLSKIISSGNVHVHADLIAGLPHENMDSFTRSFEQLFSIRPHQLQLGFLKMLHGARLRRDAEKLGYVYSSKPPYEIISSPELSEKELDRLRMAEDALERLYNSRRFLHTVEYVLSVSGICALELFFKAGEAAGECHGISLDDYTKIMLQHFLTIPGVDMIKLRDEMVCDRLCTDRSGKLPDCLKVSDPLFGKIKRELMDKKRNGGVALLYSSGIKVAAADYSDYDIVDGRWRLDILNLDEFLHL